MKCIQISVVPPSFLSDWLLLGKAVRSVLWHLWPLWTVVSSHLSLPDFHIQSQKGREKNLTAFNRRFMQTTFCWHNKFLSPQQGLWNFSISLLLFSPLFPPVFVNVPRALKFNMNNVCIFCYILYKILAVSPSFRAFNHGPPGVLWDTCSLKPSEEPERVGTAGKKENLTADLLHSTRMPPLFKRQLEVHYADRTPIERYGKAASTSEYMWSFVCVSFMSFGGLNAILFFFFH